jgi:hypothetical protein
MNGTSKLLLLLLLLAAVLVAAPPLRAQDETPVTPAESSDAPPSDDAAEETAGPAEEQPAAEEPGEPEILAAVDELAREVEEARGLKFKRPFARKLISPEDVRDHMLAQIEEEFPPGKMDRITALMARMGYMPEGLDLLETFGSLLKAGVAGMYDPQTQTLYVVEGASIQGAKPVIYHELVHALEDQYFQLDERKEALTEQGDAMAAYQAVVEGSASWLQNRYQAKHPELMSAMMADQMSKMQEQMRMLMEVPAALTAAIGLYPYGNAPRFVEAVAGDPSGIEKLYRETPVSTEQVLHREKYRVDYPYRVRLGDVSDVLPEGWTADLPDTVGELQTGLLLNEFLGGANNMFKLVRVANLPTNSVEFRDSVKVAAEGWDGDRMTGWFGPDGQCALLWASRWDTERDAREFAAAYRAGLEMKRRERGLDPLTAQVEVRGDRVLIAEGFPAEVLFEVIDAAWKRTRFVPDPRDRADLDAELLKVLNRD